METDFKDNCWCAIVVITLTFLCLLAARGLEATLADGTFYLLVLLFCLASAWSLALLGSIEAFIRWRRDRRYRRRREREHLRQQFHNRR